MVRPMVHSTKHYVQTTLSTASTGTRNVETYVDAVAVVDLNTGNEVKEGSSVKAIFLEMWAIGSVSDQFFTMVVCKLPSGLGSPIFSNMTDLNGWDGKKNIFYTTQGLASNDGLGDPMPLFRGWIKIPKSKQRMGLGDKIIMSIASRGSANITYCGFVTYKEYS